MKRFKIEFFVMQHDYQFILCFVVHEKSRLAGRSVPPVDVPGEWFFSGPMRDFEYIEGYQGWVFCARLYTLRPDIAHFIGMQIKKRLWWKQWFT